LVQEEVIGRQYLRVGRGSNQVHRPFGHKYAVAVISTVLCCEPREELAKELGILRRAFDANNVGGDFCGFGAMADSRSVQFKVWKNRNKLVPIRHRLELRLFKVRCQGECGFVIDFNQHQLVHEVIAKVLEVGDVGWDFRNMSDGCRALRPQTIRLKKDSCLLEPGEKVIVLALELDVSEGAVAENVAANANIQLVLVEGASGRYVKKLLKVGLAGW